jgi:hypothetical protein
MAHSRVLVAGTVVVLVGLGASLRLSADDDTAASTDGAAQPTTTTVPAPPTARGIAPSALGDRIRSGGLELVLERVTDPFESSDAVITPPADRRWVSTDVNVTNLSAGPIPVDGRTQLSLLDGNDVRFHVADTAEHLAGIDGVLQPGQSRRATLIFETPESARNLRLSFDGLPEEADPILVALG